MQPHAVAIKELKDKLKTDDDGLSDSEAGKRLEKHGPNALEESSGPSVIEIFLDQFKDYLVYILLVAIIFSLGVGLFPGESPRYHEAAIIAIIVFSNGLLGFYQDFRAEQSLAKLTEQTSPSATVIRGGEEREIDSEDLVPGDLILLDQGDLVPADARLLDVESLATNEAPITGESEQVHKGTDPVDSESVLAEQTNMVFKGTNVVRGRGRAIVTATGMNTAIGEIAGELQLLGDEKTPFQREVEDLGRSLGLLITGFVLLITLIQGTVTGMDPITLFLLAIGLVVAAIPESLPVVVTFALARGSRRMMNRDALVRRLPVVESLGSVNYIVTDKTGTLTQGTMTVRKLFYAGHDITVSGSGTDTEGDFMEDGESVTDNDYEELLRCGLYCNNAREVGDGFEGDPTEVALVVAARKAGVTPSVDRQRSIPFSSDRKRMTTISEDNKAYMKGAPDTVIERCDRIATEGGVRELTDEDREKVQNKVDEYANEALRVLGFASKTVDDSGADEETIEDGMVFLGLQGMIDPPREEVKDAVKDCRDAGIKVVMATGDDVTTASAIGEELGFTPEGAVTGKEIEKMGDDELMNVTQSTEIFARVSPKHKVRILDSLKNQDLEVAMTGDGVNDAPALKDSDVGIAMGQQGTEVAQQSSDIVLRDDNFVTIRDAIKEGRTIFDNIRKVTNYLLSTNAAEVMFVFLGALIGSLFFREAFSVQHVDAVVLTAVMILWVNFSTDGPPSIAMASDESVPGVMDRPPRRPDEPIIDAQMISMIAVTGPLAALVYLPTFFKNVKQFQLAQSTLFTSLAVFELIMVQIVRRQYKLSLLKNGWLMASLAVAFIAQLAILYTPLANWFEVVSLGLNQWIKIVVASMIFIISIVLYQWISLTVFGPRRGAE